MAVIRFAERDETPIESYPAHTHGTVWELLIYTQGHGQSFCNDQGYTFKPGTIIGIPPSMRHHEVPTEPYTTIHLHIRDWDRPANPIHLQDTPDGNLRQVFDLIYQEYIQRAKGWQEHCCVYPKLWT